MSVHVSTWAHAHWAMYFCDMMCHIRRLDADGMMLGLARKALFSAAVIGVTAANNPREVRAGMALIKNRAKPDEAALADGAVPLQKLMGR